jgi:hypothetical protein
VTFRPLLLLVVLIALASAPAPRAPRSTAPRPVAHVAAQRAADGTAPAPVLQAPASAADGDLDLYLHWRAARTRQRLLPPDEAWHLRQYTNLVVLGEAAHRALVLLPSARGAPSLALFKVAVPADSNCELVTWVAIEPQHATRSDGVDFGVAVAREEDDPTAAPIAFTRLSRKQASTWREVRVDLAPYQGRTVWMVLASRDRGTQRGDWLLWGDPRIRVKSQDAPVIVDLGAPDPRERRSRHVPWSEATVFKTYSLFNDAAARHLGTDWTRRSFPWLSSVRLFSALGANWGPALDADYDAAVGKADASSLRWEADWAKRYEFFRDGPEWAHTPIADRFDWREFDALNENVHRAGLALNMNLSGAPEWFTGHRGYYRNYHLNELPVVDAAGWQDYVARLFAHLATTPWFASAEFALFSEPNCMWIDQFGAVSRVGFQGPAEAFARQYLWTWQAMKPYAAPGQVHLGPWVVEPDPGNPIINNLPEYLRALKQVFADAGEPLPSWSAFAFNAYETPQLTIENLPEYKIAHVRALLAGEFPDRNLPLRLDEFGVHPLIASDFEAATGVRLSTTRWEMTWHAETLALLVDERIERAASWLPVFMVFPPALKSYASHLFLSHAIGAVDVTVTPANELVATRAADPDGAAARDCWVRPASRSTNRIGYLWSADDGGRAIRLALWRYPRSIGTDTRIAAEDAPRMVEVRLPGEAAQRWSVRLTGYEDQPVPRTLAAATTRRLASQAFPALPAFTRAESTVAGTISLEMTPGDLFLLDLDALPGG